MDTENRREKAEAIVREQKQSLESLSNRREGAEAIVREQKQWSRESNSGEGAGTSLVGQRSKISCSFLGQVWPSQVLGNLAGGDEFTWICKWAFSIIGGHLLIARRQRVYPESDGTTITGSFKSTRCTTGHSGGGKKSMRTGRN